jgi:cyanophycinase
MNGLGVVDSIESIYFDAEDIAINRMGANGAMLQRLARQAEGVFLGGGYQSLYTDILTGTQVLSEINTRLAAQTVVIGGTSAGMASLADQIYIGGLDSVTSPEALNDPFDDNMVFHPRIFTLPGYMSNVITDTHFKERDRMGRSLTFLGRMWKDGRPSQMAVCADEGTGVAIEANGLGKVYGPGSVYFLSTIGPTTAIVEDGEAEDIPLTFHTIKVQRVQNHGRFDLSTWSMFEDGHVGVTYHLTVTAGQIGALDWELYPY